MMFPDTTLTVPMVAASSTVGGAPISAPPSSDSTPSTLVRELAPRDLAKAAPETLPPMTTSWRRPRKCIWSYKADASQPSDSMVWLDYNPVEGATTLSCYPDGMFDGGRTGIFSPGKCPNGWSTVSMSPDTYTHTNSYENRQQITTAVCCSSNYTFHGNKCLRTHSTIEAVPMTYNSIANAYERVPSATTTLLSALVAVHTIQVLIRQADKEKLGWVQDDTKSRRSEGLWTGTLLGIGFGAAVFAVLLIAAIYLGIRCCRQKKKWQSPNEGENLPMEISGVQYEVRQFLGPKPPSRCSTCGTDAHTAESSPQAAMRRSEVQPRRTAAQMAAADEAVEGSERERKAGRISIEENGF